MEWGDFRNVEERAALDSDSVESERNGRGGERLSNEEFMRNVELEYVGAGQYKGFMDSDACWIMGEESRFDKVFLE